MRPVTVPRIHYSAAVRYPMTEIARDLGVELRPGSYASLDRANRVVHTREGDSLAYDALVLAVGARGTKRFQRATTLEDTRLVEQLHSLMHDVETGHARRIACVVPSNLCWPLPVYDFALLASACARDANVEVAITLVTPEEEPLAVFGGEISAVVRRRLEAAGVLIVTAVRCAMSSSGHITTYPHGDELVADRVVTVAQLFGPSVPGVPRDAEGGFISVDEHCRVTGLEHVFAAGDGTTFPVKHGGIAAQQAEAAAQAIAAEAGTDIEPKPLDPVLVAAMVGGPSPLYLRARVLGGEGFAGEMSETPLWPPETIIAAPHLNGYLASRQSVGART